MLLHGIALDCMVSYAILYCMLLHCWLRCAGCVSQDAYLLHTMLLRRALPILNTQEHPPPPVPHVPYNANTRKIKVRHNFSIFHSIIPCTLKCVDKSADDQFQYLGTTERAQHRSDDHPLLNGRAEVS